jgi:hypothetical protein
MREYIEDCIGGRELTEDLKVGLIIGVTMYAWWKNGVQYVGTCGRTLVEVLQEIEDVFQKK